VRADGVAEGLRADQAVRIDRQIGYFDRWAIACGGATLFFERLAGIEYGFVFNLSRNDVLGGSCGVANNTEDGVIVGFGAAAREDDFLRTGADETGDLFASGFDRSASALAGRVDGSGVAELGGKIGQHGVEDGGLDGGGGVVIEIDARHT
jgi:hypothetical protein